MGTSKIHIRVTNYVRFTVIMALNGTDMMAHYHHSAKLYWENYHFAFCAVPQTTACKLVISSDIALYYDVERH